MQVGVGASGVAPAMLVTASEIGTVRALCDDASNSEAIAARLVYDMLRSPNSAAPGPPLVRRIALRGRRGEGGGYCSQPMK